MLSSTIWLLLPMVLIPVHLLAEEVEALAHRLIALQELEVLLEVDGEALISSWIST